MLGSLFSPFLLLSFVPLIIFAIIIAAIVAYFTNRNHNQNLNPMDPNQMKPKATASDFLLNVGAIIALYTVVSYLLNLLFIVIEKAYPQVTNSSYYYYGSTSISWPVSILIVLFPVFIAIMWSLEKNYTQNPEKRQVGVHKWLTYITLFVGGSVFIGDLVTVIYYYIDGQDLTMGFILKALTVLVITLIVFLYYISDVKGKLTSGSKTIYLAVSTLLIIGSIVWGFSVLGSPRTQRLIKYDNQKVADLQNLNSYVLSYFQTHSGLPGSLTDLADGKNSYFNIPLDQQSGQPYEYHLIGQSAKTYELCAEFNKDSKASKDSNRNPYLYSPAPYGNNWDHPAGHHCFSLSIPVDQYPKLPM